SGRRAHGDVRRARRAHRTHARRRRSDDLRTWRIACGAVGGEAEAGPLFDDGRAGVEGFLGCLSSRASAKRETRDPYAAVELIYCGVWVPAFAGTTERRQWSELKCPTVFSCSS